MTTQIGSLSTFLLILLFPAISFATLFTSQSGGDWNNSATWDQGLNVPGPGDDVVIDGHTVLIQSANANVNNLTITNNGTALSQLEMLGSYTVNIFGDLHMIAENVNQDIKLLVNGNTILNITGDFLMERTSDNNQSANMAFIASDDSKIFINGAFDFYYRNSNGESGLDIQTYNNAEITVSQKSVFQQDGGDYFLITFAGSSKIMFLDSLNLILNTGNALGLTISGAADLTIGKTLTAKNLGGVEDLTITASLGGDISIAEDLNLTAGASRNLELNSTTGLTIIDVNKNINMDATTTASLALNLGSFGVLNIGGNLERPNKFGSLSMTNSSQLNFNGTGQQVIPISKYDEIITGDSLEFTNVVFNNPNGFILGGNIRIDHDLTLTDGILTSSPDSILIIENGVNITNPSKTSYVDGPMIKRGTHAGSTFLFPVGDNGIYAPLEIEAITDPSVEYTIKPIGCPPPLGVKNGLLKNINQEFHWELERTDGLALGEITLHWDNADDFGITDTASLVVVYYDISTGWTSLGRTNATGNIGALAGAISIGCPPPLGIKTFGFGSTKVDENAAPLAVEMTNFRAYKSNDQSKVFLEWQTVSEENSNYFIVEKSYDGTVFKKIARVEAAQNSTTTQNYISVDDDPQKGNNYYRIQEVSQDQFMTFSNLVNVFFNGQEDIPIIYPNPVQNQVRVFSKDLESDDFFIKVLDINGQCLYAGNQRAQDGQLMLSTSTLNVKNPGMYFLSYEIGGEIKSLKFFKITH